MADFALQESLNWFHVKSEWYKNHEISTLWYVDQFTLRIFPFEADCVLSFNYLLDFRIVAQWNKGINANDIRFCCSKI